MVEDAIIGRLPNISQLGIRITVGAIFIFHSIFKFSPNFQGFLVSVGLPAEMQIPIALLELVGGILLISGVLSRLSAAILSIDMLGAIFFIKKLKAFSGSGGWEFELLILVALFTLVVVGPGKISIFYMIKKIPRFLQ